MGCVPKSRANLNEQQHCEHRLLPAFAKDAKGVILFRDKDPKELEVNGRIPLTKPLIGPAITGIVISGDTKQLVPTVLSANDRPGFNEFSRQTQTSFAVRLLKAGHPALTLREQRRFRPVFADFLNKRVYHGEMRSHPSTDDIRVKPQWERMIRDYLRPGPDSSIDKGNIVLNVDSSECRVDHSTKSKFNFPHVQAVVNLVLKNHEYKGYEANDIKIITPYSAQRLLYRKAFFHLADKLPTAHHPSVETFDSMQGCEAKLVILDFTASAAKSASDLGF